MIRHLLLVLALLLLVAECVAQFVAHDQTFTTLFALVGIAAMVVRWAISPQTSTEACEADCAKCRESESTDPEFESFAWEHGDLKRGEGL